MSTKLWNPYILGVLSKGTEHPSGRSVFINNNNQIQFYLKILSNPPHSFPKSQKEVTSYGLDLENHGFEDEFLDDLRRKHELEDFLEDSLVVFQVEKKSTSTDEFFTTKNMELLLKKTSFSDEMSFFPVPFYTERNEKKSVQDYTKDEFIYQLQEGKFIGRNDKVSQELEDTSRIILYKTKDNSYMAFGEFENHRYAHGGFNFTKSNGILKSAVLPPEIVKEIYFFKDVAFVSIDLEYAIMQLLEETNNEYMPSAAKEQPKTNAKTSASEVLETGDNAFFVSKDATEADFLNQFIAEAKKMTMEYNIEDYYNFHTAVKAGGLVILAGMSGTGKSQLVNAYQKALNLDMDSFLMIPVSPTWADDSDLIGYPDIINNVYRAADTGLVKLLIEAQKNPEKTFLVCFDEMNLAKVEHYFYQFLSVLEMEKGKRRLRLYNSDLQNKFYNGINYPSEVLIGDNVIFIGTVNFDESTHHFSDKVLDRSNIIQLKVEPFINLLLENEKQVEKPDLHKPSFDIQQFVQNDKKILLTHSELQLLWQIHLLLNQVSEDMGIGPRVVKHIDRYVKNLSDLPDCPITRGDAVDIQLVQRILPKLRGSEDIMKSLIGIYEPRTETIAHSKIIDLLDKYNDVSEFERTRRKLLGKSKELLRHGYTV